MKKITIVKKMSVIVCLVCIVGVFAACRRQGSAELSVEEDSSDAVPVKLSIQEGGSIVFGSATEMSNFDPFTSMTADARSVNFNIFDGLVNVASDGSFVPAIAERYEVSPDAQSYTFYIRTGVRFHDGHELGKEDVLYSIRKAILSSLTGYDKIDSFVFTDSMTLRIQLKVPDAGFVAYLTTPIVENNAQDLALHPIGTGPYKLTEYMEQDHITLTKFTDYFGKQGHLDEITIKFVSSQANLTLSFQAGSIDGFSANADTVLQLDEDSIRTYQTNSNSVQLLALNNAVVPFTDVRVRKALNYLVDVQEIIEAVNYGYGIKVGSALIPSLSKYYDASLASVYEQNVDVAKSLLAEAGYEDGFRFTITVPSVYTVHVRTAEVIVNQLAAAGIQANIRQVDWATWLEQVYQKRQYEATIISLDGPLAYPTSFLSRYQSAAHNNFVNFTSTAYDEVYNKAVSTVNEDEKIFYFKQAQQILNQEAASVFLQDISMITVYNKRYAGFEGYPLYVTDYSAIYCVAE